ncbi:helix-turn-helix transcriptional regulator [Cupriavidus basilensis]|uniref:Helix-turn-helix transcriptional regulator n=1 Tax=Cupriavidus basilensis TaxID=68895 RepID=A0ABT6AKB2_9BURK|nr:helix-turn-helix transcriptional regulator [Cupriavidus basilensis]MDF3832752.1 helix-turn-helix transcriptional regulator [Cupriavidus basilensis]
MVGDPLKSFGLHLAELRKQRGWSQEKLALESGMARSYLSGIERGVRNVSLVNICALAGTLGVNTSEMLNFDDGNGRGNGGSGALVLEQKCAEFNITPAQRLTVRHMALMNDTEQDAVAGIARVIAARAAKDL